MRQTKATPIGIIFYFIFPVMLVGKMEWGLPYFEMWAKS
jgi:hypothetical protein